MFGRKHELQKRELNTSLAQVRVAGHRQLANHRLTMRAGNIGKVVRALQVVSRSITRRACVERVTAVEQAKLACDDAITECDRSPLQFQHWREEVQRDLRA